MTCEVTCADAAWEKLGEQVSSRHGRGGSSMDGWMDEWGVRKRIYDARGGVPGNMDDPGKNGFLGTARGEYTRMDYVRGA